jgi:GTP1/Obg family GTP-binding protein
MKVSKIVHEAINKINTAQQFAEHENERVSGFARATSREQDLQHVLENLGEARGILRALILVLKEDDDPIDLGECKKRDVYEKV